MFHSKYSHIWPKSRNIMKINSFKCVFRTIMVKVRENFFLQLKGTLSYFPTNQNTFLNAVSGLAVIKWVDFIWIIPRTVHAPDEIAVYYFRKSVAFDSFVIQMTFSWFLRVVRYLFSISVNVLHLTIGFLFEASVCLLFHFILPAI